MIGFYRSFFFVLLFSTVVNAQVNIDCLLLELDTIKESTPRLAKLDVITEAMQEQEHPQVSFYLDSTIALAKKLGEWDIAALKLRYVIQEHLASRNYDNALFLIEGTLANKNKFKRKSSKAHLLFKRAIAYYHKNEFNKSIEDFTEAACLFSEAEEFISEADAYLFRGQVYSDLNDFPSAVKDFHAAYTLYDNLQNTEHCLITLMEIATSYTSNGFMDKANHERNEIINLSLEHHDYLRAAENTVLISKAYRKKGDLVTLKKYLEMAESFHDSIPNGATKNYINQQIYLGHFYHNLGHNNMAMALHYLEKAESLADSLKSTNSYKDYVSFAQIAFLKKIGDYKSALATLRVITEDIEKKGRISDKIELEEHSVDIYLSLGNSEKASVHFERYLKLKDSSNNKAKQDAFLYYQGLFENNLKETEILRQKSKISLLEKDKELYNSRVRNLWMTLFSLLVLSAGFVCFIRKKEMKKQAFLKERLNNNHIDLIQFTQRLVDKSREQEIMQNELDELRKLNSHEGQLMKLQSLINTKILTQKDWEEFRKKFMEVFPLFFVNIKEKGFFLTDAE